MNPSRFLAAVAAGVFLLVGAGCQKAAEPPVALVGKARVTDAQAMQLTGATMVRQIKPGDAVTMDFRQERVTVETDAGTGKITRAMCG